MVLYNIEANYAKKLGKDWGPEELTDGKCPAPKTNPKDSSKPKAKDQCGCWYEFLFDHFEIFGKNFPENKFGTDGSGLKEEIEGCGELTSWSFSNLEKDPHGFEWKATGNLPIGVKACVGRAVVNAGGTSPDGCTGPG